MVVRQPDYLKTLDGALTAVPLQTWKDYLTFGTSAAYADYLPAAFVDALSRNLLAAFKVGIDDLEWMSPATKVQAQAKLAKYSLKIAYPYRWRQDERCARCLRLPGRSRMSRHCANRTKPLARRPLRMKSCVQGLHITMCSNLCEWRRTWHSTTNSSRKP